jgi:hypothetical protein
MTDPTVTDLRRELEKALEALNAAATHLARHAEANAVLHCAEQVMYSPLHAKVMNAAYGIHHALERTTPSDRSVVTDETKLVNVLTDLDRCQHGRHQGDACGPADDCTGTSAGNPHLRPGAVIGYTMRRDFIVMPDRDDKNDPDAWLRPNPGTES